MSKHWRMTEEVWLCLASLIIQSCCSIPNCLFTPVTIAVYGCDNEPLTDYEALIYFNGLEKPATSYVKKADNSDEGHDARSDSSSDAPNRVLTPLQIYYNTSLHKDGTFHAQVVKGDLKSEIFEVTFAHDQCDVPVEYSYNVVLCKKVLKPVKKSIRESCGAKRN